MGLISKNRPWHSLAEWMRAFGFRESAIAEYETEFARMVKAPHAIAFPHCRTAIRDLLTLEGAKGRQVLLPAYNCIVVPHAITLAGAEPGFLDISLRDFNTPLSAFSKAVTKKTAALIPTHMYGNQVDLEGVEDLAKGCLVIEDTSLALYPAYRPKTKNARLVTVYSTGYTKHLSTLHGGMVVCHDADTAKRIRAFRDERYPTRTGLVALAEQALEFLVLRFGFEPAIYQVLALHRKIPFLLKRVDTRNFEEPSFPKAAEQGFTPFQAKLGLAQIGKAETILSRRRQNAELYFETLKDLVGIEPMRPVSENHFSHYPVLVSDRDAIQFRERMARCGVESGRMLDYTCTELNLYKQYRQGNYPNASRAAREVVNLPNYPSLTQENARHIAETVRTLVLESFAQKKTGKTA